MPPLISLLLAIPLAQAPMPELAPVLAEIRALREQVGLLTLQLREREGALEQMRQELKALGTEAAGKERGGATSAAEVAAPFTAAPALSSDAVGVARAVVFAPRVEADSPRSRDLVSLRVRPVEVGSARAVAELELVSDQPGVDLPVDANGALYVVDWSTSEGHTYTLVLRDGASGQAAATGQVKPLQNKGRFIFVGYRLE